MVVTFPGLSPRAALPILCSASTTFVAGSNWITCTMFLSLSLSCLTVPSLKSMPLATTSVQITTHTPPILNVSMMRFLSDMSTSRLSNDDEIPNFSSLTCTAVADADELVKMINLSRPTVVLLKPTTSVVEVDSAHERRMISTSAASLSSVCSTALHFSSTFLQLRATSGRRWCSDEDRAVDMDGANVLIHFQTDFSPSSGKEAPTNTKLMSTASALSFLLIFLFMSRCICSK
mmetsp:Transcript_36987/g.95901  ORF Transcript_36987/g.95901 Transcript_36987/m.95901 type:complete len:233 (+) Transcript_36987:600-1298(+)